MTEPARTLLPAIEVNQAREALRCDVAVLTEVQVRVIEYDDGTEQTFTAPPLLRQLENDVHGGGAPIGAFSPRSKPPLGIDALTVLTDIDSYTLRPPHRDRTEWFDAWANACASSAPGALLDGAERVAGWRASVEVLLDPLPRFQVRGQVCPSCGAAKVHDRTDHGAGEHHARPALEVDPQTGQTRCRCCSATWAPELHEHLRMVLEQQREETLAAGSDPTVCARTDAERGVRWFESAGQRATPDHAPDLSGTDPAVIQCRARVPHPEPKPHRRRRRCSSLLDVHGQCPNAEAHDWEPPTDDPDVAHGD